MAKLDIITTLTDKATPGLNKLGGAINELNNGSGVASRGIGGLAKAGRMAAGALVTGFEAATVAAIGFGAASVLEFKDFEAGMNEVFTLLPDISGEAMGTMKDQVIALSEEIGKVPDETVPALYQALSAGVPQDNVFDFLRTANEAATGGVTNLETAVDGLTSVVNAYGAESMSATQASDLMFTAVKLGKTNFEQLSRSLFNVTPTAAALNVSFGDITAALANMTAAGVPTSVATTQLRSVLVELSKEGALASEIFQEMSGVTFKQFMSEGGNMAGALKLMEEAAAENGVAINDLFSSVEAGNAALALSGPNLEKYEETIKTMGESTGATSEAFARMESGFSRIFDILKAKGATFLIQIGEQLTPAVKAFSESFAAWTDTAVPRFMDGLGTVITAIGTFKTMMENGAPATNALYVAVLKLANGFGMSMESAMRLAGNVRDFVETVQRAVAPITNWVRENIQLKDVLIAVGVVLGGVILSALYSIVTAVAPVIAAFAALVLIVSTVRRAFEQDFAGIRDFVDRLYQSFQTFVGGLKKLFSGDIDGAFRDFRKAFENAFNAILEFLGNVGREVGPKLKAFFTAVVDWFSRQDWKAIGRNVVELIVDGLTALGDLMLRAMQSAQDAIFRWAGGSTWSEVGQKIVEIIVNGLNTFGEWAQSTLDTWQQAFWTWMEGVDWKQLAYDLITSILEGLKSFNDSWKETEANWTKAFQDWITETDWEGIALDLITKFVVGLTQFTAEIGPTLAEWFTAFSTWITDTDFKQLGLDILNGIAEGLGDTAIVIEALLEVASGAWDAVTDFFESASPSKKMARLGGWLMDGLGLGIEMNRRKPIDAMKDVSVEVSTQTIESFSQALDDIAAGISSAMSSLTELASNPLKAADVLPVFHSFTEIISTAVGMFGAMAYQMEQDSHGHVWQLVRDFSDTVGKIGDAIGAAIGGMEAIADFSVPAGTFTTFDDLVVVFEYVTRAMSDVARQIEGGVMERAQLFSDTAAQILDLIIPGVDALERIAEYIRVSDIRTKIIAFTTDLTTAIAVLAIGFSEALAPMANAVQFAGEIAGKALALLGTVPEGIDALTAVADYTKDRDITTTAMDFTADLMELVTVLADGFEKALFPIEQALIDAEELAGPAEALIGVVSPAFDALEALGEYSRQNNIAARVLYFTTDLMNIATILSQGLAAIPAHVRTAVDDAREISGPIQELIAIIRPGIDALAAMKDYEHMSGLAFGVALFVGQLMDAAEWLANGIADTVGDFGAALESSREVVEDITAVINVIQPGIAALAALSEYEYVSGLGFGIMVFTAQLVSAAETLATELAESAADFADAFDQASAVSGSISAVVSVIQPGIDAIAAMATYEVVAGLEEKVKSFADSLVTVAETLATQIGKMGEDTATAVEAAGAASADISAIVNLVRPGIDALAGLAEYEAVANLKGKVETFTDQLVTAVNTLATDLTIASNKIGDKVTTAASFAESAANLTTNVTTTVDHLKTLSEAQQPNLASILDYLTTAAENVADTINGSHASLNGKIVDAANTFEQRTGEITDAIIESIAHLKRLAEADTPGSLGAALQAMIGAMQSAGGPAYEAGKLVGGRFIDGVVDAINAGAAAVANAARGVMMGAANSAGRASNQGYGVGLNMVNSMARGVQRGSGGLYAAVNRAAVGAAQAARTALEISSPSAVFEAIGHQSIEGFMRPFQRPIGINAEIQTSLTRATQGLTAQPVAALAPAVSGPSQYNTINITLPNGATPSPELESMVRSTVQTALDEAARSAERRSRF